MPTVKTSCFNGTNGLALVANASSSGTLQYVQITNIQKLPNALFSENNQDGLHLLEFGHCFSN